MCMCVCMCMRVCGVCVCVGSKLLQTHTHTHTHTLPVMDHKLWWTRFLPVMLMFNILGILYNVHIYYTYVTIYNVHRIPYTIC